MVHKLYLKAPPGHVLRYKPSLFHQLRYVLSLILITLGISFLTTVVYPLIEYQLVQAPRFRATTLPSPPHTLAQESPVFLPEISHYPLDYTQARNWFPQSPPSPHQSLSSSVAYYTLSIPKLGIDHALVKVGGEDLKASLIQYQGTALPGELGNPVIYGHSVLPQYFNPKNYTTIFSTLYTLEPGDEIIVHLDDVDYTYFISHMYETGPDDLSPLAQAYDNYHLTLITCTPPGTYLRRLIVKAELQ